MRACTQQDYRARILAVLQHIHGHLDHALSLAELARLAHFSPYHFHRVFHGMVGESVMELVRRLRMERAAHRLRHGHDPVTHIAFEAGYEAHESFTRAFRAMFGESPSAFRGGVTPLVCKCVPSGVHYQADGQVQDFVTMDTGGTTMEVEVRTLPPMHVAYVRHVGPYTTCKAAWDKLCGWAGPRGLLGPQTRCLGICYDDPEATPPDQIRYDACVTVDPTCQGGGEVGVQDIPGGEYAVALHRGSYSNLHRTWKQFLGEWLPASGRELGDAPSFELYCNDPHTTPEQDLLVEIYVPLGS
ncbi:MAG TPA: AraC family transcriptional regulator [Phycisphaerae bacterium]|nr:AraC family transcriptional regulator [Phycisphaerae bacterium]HRY66594.1 AraC family transcriptional regulator [Phycisphaerae bacterium]HSA27014.1 AraC family transcriptional regulator [Phycisphaerae bacterium]